MQVKMNEITKLQEIKVLLKTGQITYDEAKEMAMPYIEKINQKIDDLSKKFKMSARTISFSSFMR